MKKISKNLIGITGEHLVSAMLTSHDYICALTQKNTEHIDLLVAKGIGEITYQIQVKTFSGSKPEWILSKKNESEKGKYFFYIFCNLNNGESNPDFYIVQSQTVASFIKRSHKNHLNGHGKFGQKRKDSNIRKFSDFDKKYLLKNNIDDLLIT